MSRITLSFADPNFIELAVTGSMFHPGPEFLPTAAQVRGHPMSRYHGATGDRSPVLMSDVLAAGWRLDPVSEAVMRDLRISDQQLSIPVGVSGGYDGWALIAEEEFDQRVVEEVCTLQRLLIGLDRHLRVLDRMHQMSLPDAGAPRLTARERVILTLLARGSTAQAIARQLAISPRTVHKHQEHLYRKLGASDRLSAVLAGQRTGLLPGHYP